MSLDNAKEHLESKQFFLFEFFSLKRKNGWHAR